jgi:hypothetical protein
MFDALDVSDTDFKRMMALAIFDEVPIYPENAEAAKELERLYRELIEDGFTAKDESGEERKLHFAKPVTLAFAEKEAKVGEFIYTTSVHPADIILSRARQADREQRLAEAERIIGSLQAAITDLEATLSDDQRVENEIQRCLTRYPILFGLQYRRVIPKHKLGKEYEMDYALEKVSGLVDIVEIEASNHQLFTRSGNPRSELVHAEQQVLDWLDWISTHTEYGRASLPGLIQPQGFVVIGRRHTLSTDDSNRLRRRNITWGGNLIVMTYDDILDNARSMLTVLQGIPHEHDADIET